MKPVILNKPFSSEEEYFAFEEQSELKHEYINATLFEMSGTSKYHNKTERKLDLYSATTDVINLPKLSIAVPVKDIYPS